MTAAASSDKPAVPAWRIVLAIVVCAMLLAASFYFRGAPASTDLQPPAEALETLEVVGAGRLKVAPPNLLKPLSAKEAAVQNMERAYADRPNEPAASYRLTTNERNLELAVHCLAQAVYYEAAGEGLDGGRAVAQVVINRLRHAAYPSTVCGVVYQGVNQAPACQFSFTCDGSLGRVPDPRLWESSRRIAAEALAGNVFRKVGLSTHFHANYVLPYWADSLDKMASVGRHIFYRLPGGMGAPGLFRGHHSGNEQVALASAAPIDLAMEAEPVEEEVQAGAIEDASLIAPALPEPIAADAQLTPLLADSGAGALEADSSGLARTRKPAPSASGCPRTRSTRLEPLRPNALRVDEHQDEC